MNLDRIKKNKGNHTVMVSARITPEQKKFIDKHELSASNILRESIKVLQEQISKVRE